MNIIYDDTLARFQELLDYDADTGIFTWKISTSNRVCVGSRAGCLHKASGYIVIRVNKRLYKAHRLAWLFVYKEWPTEIDHRSGNKQDNRISNLRIATHSQNMANSRIRVDNSSGYKGVYRQNYPKRGIVYTAFIQTNGKNLYLGTFETAQYAAAIRNWAATMLHNEFARVA